MSTPPPHAPAASQPRRLSNPPNPWASTHVEWLEPPPETRLEVFEEEAKSLLSRNSSPDVPFTWSANPYRGCQHACAYYYARPGHQHLSFGAGTDFERKLVVKTNAPELFALELRRPSVRGHWIALSGVTDCYQPLEAHYGLTRRLLKVALQRQVGVGVITKAALVRRDRDLLARLARGPGASVTLSIPFADAAMARRIEPGASGPGRRFAALRALHEAGVPVGVAIAPLIPGLNDDQVPAILEEARAAGAEHAFLIPLRLPAEVRPVFLERLQAAYPDRADKVVHALEELRGGRLNDPRFGHRMQGGGVRFTATRRLFDVLCSRLGFRTSEPRIPRPEGARGWAAATGGAAGDGSESAAQGTFDWS